MGLRGQTPRHNEDIVFVWEGAGNVCDVLHRIGEKVLNAIQVWAPRNQVDVF